MGKRGIRHHAKESICLQINGEGQPWRERYKGHFPRDPHTRITLNCSGSIVEIYEDVLQRFPNSLLGDPERRDKLWVPHRKEYFLDRHKACFEAVLQFYQTGILKRPHEVTVTHFLEEFEHYEFEEAIVRQYKEREGILLDSIRDLPDGIWRRRIWTTFELPAANTPSKIYAAISFVVIVISIAAFCTETLPKYEKMICTEKILPGVNGTTTKKLVPNFDNIFFKIENYCVGFFTMEYLMRLLTCPPSFRWKFMKKPFNIIDLLTIIPYYPLVFLIYFSQNCYIAERSSALLVLRALRVFRVFKFSNHFKPLRIYILAIKDSLQDLKVFLFLVLVGCILLAGAVLAVEDPQRSKISSIPEGIWWAIGTMTTVGYGDVYPISRWGRLVGIVCFIVGCLVVALPAPVIVANFNHYYRNEMGRIYDQGMHF